MSETLLLYSHCIIVSGHSRSSICDLQRNNIYLIPNALADLFIDSRYIQVLEVSPALVSEDKKVLDEYLDFLIANDLGFYCSNEQLSKFPPMPVEWLFPAHISHCVLDTKKNLHYFNEGFLKQLEKLCCNFIQFRFFESVSFQYLDELMNMISTSQIKSVEIIIPRQLGLDFYNIATLFVSHNKKIGALIISGANESSILKEGINGMGYIIKSVEEIKDASHCGVIDVSLFSINIPTYTESLAHNSCLNRKISIDTEGNIKNCPSMKESFGNISNTLLEEALNHPGFKKYWDINKDQIRVCKDCEFRHVCTDCRAYLENPEDIYSKPLKCGYSPYTCEWEDWSTSLLKQKSIDYYTTRDIAK